MSNKVSLNNVDHHDLKIIPGYVPGFGDAVNQLLIVPTEFEDVQREYPILFRRDEAGAFQAIALLGFDRDENLFLSDAGWTSRYVPAVLRRGPFSIVMQPRLIDGEARREPMVSADLDDPRLSRTDGLPLFLPHGGNSPQLEQIARLLLTLHEGVGLAAPMFAAFEALELLAPVRLEVKLGDERTYDLPDFHAVATDRLAELRGPELERLHREGLLRLAMLAAASLGNLARLVELKSRAADGR